MSGNNDILIQINKKYMRTYNMYLDLTKPAMSKMASLKSSNLMDEYGRGVCTQNFPGRETEQHSQGTERWSVRLEYRK